jgi:hypothetical protein
MADGSLDFASGRAGQSRFMREIVFETESEVGQCDCESAAASGYGYGEPDYGVLFARTQASRTGRAGLLRIEQHCYVRQGADLPEQQWVAPRIFLEPDIASRQEMEALARDLHGRYVALARQQIEGRFSV